MLPDPPVDVEPRNAASVVLIRNGLAAEGGGLEIYFLRRHARMAFAAGVAVFPGGGVDDRDQIPAAHWCGPDPAVWAERLGVDDDLAISLVAAAVRETFEESGVLLAGPTSSTVVSDTTGAEWEADREALVSGVATLAEVLSRRGLQVRSDLLVPWACWVTPVGVPRRYRTWFFLADLPVDQATRDVSTESEDVMWSSANDALAAVHHQQLEMWPPQYATCAALFDVGSTAEAFAIANARAESGAFPPARFVSDEEHLGGLDLLEGLKDQMRSRTDAR